MFVQNLGWILEIEKNKAKIGDGYTNNNIIKILSIFDLFSE